MSFQLLETANFLLERSGGATSFDACRAISTIYYALFQCTAKDCADVLVGIQTKSPPQRAWQHVYRSLSHTVINDRCKNIETMRSKGFPLSLREYARFLRSMQWKREKADYAFSIEPDIVSVRSDTALAYYHMTNYLRLEEYHRRAFAVYVLFKEDKHEKKDIPL